MSTAKNSCDSNMDSDKDSIESGVSSDIEATIGTRERKDHVDDLEGLEEICPISTISMHEVTRKTSHMTRVTTRASVATKAGVSVSQDPDFEVEWIDGSAEDPKSWSTWTKSRIVFSCTLSSATCILYSSAYISGIPGMANDLHMANETVALLGLTTYLLGFAAGSLLWAPLSETYGRRPVYIATLIPATLFVIGCALSKNAAAMLITRFFAGMLGCTALSNSPGSINDVIAPKNRALAFSCWGLGVMNGPVMGPLIGGFAFQYLGWRWIHWIILMLSGVSSLLMATVPETFKPALLRGKVAKMQKDTGDQRWWCVDDETETSFVRLRTSLIRPFSLTFNEPILWFWDFFIMINYSIVYLYFVLYPRVFEGIYGWSAGLNGLSYLGIGLGNVITVLAEPWLRRWTNKLKLDHNGVSAPEAKVAIVCAASVLMPIGAFWFAWTCSANVPWILPVLSGIPFGAGTSAAFIYGCSYVAQSYGSYATSALAGNVVVRVVAGACLPLAGPKIWDSLGPHWTGTLLAILETMIVPVPFIFYRYGHVIRRKSKFASQL